MTTHLLDTNTVSNLAREPRGLAYAAFARLGRGDAAINVVVAAELRFGLVKRPNARMEARLMRVIGSLPILELDVTVIQPYAELRAYLERRGEIIGANDLLIASHALALGATVVTGNVGEFGRVPGLKIENWQRP